MEAKKETVDKIKKLSFTEFVAKTNISNKLMADKKKLYDKYLKK